MPYRDRIDQAGSVGESMPVLVTSAPRVVRWWPLILVALGIALLVPRILHLEDELVWLSTVSDILAIIATLAGFILLGLVGREGEDARLATLDQVQMRTADFPFHVVYSTAELTNILLPDPTGEVPLPDRDVPYIPRDLPDLDQAFLEDGRVLLRGRSKTGKTRAVIELLRGYWRTYPTVLVLKRTAELHAPTFAPSDLPRRNLVILIDDLHVHASACRRQQTPVSAALSNVVDFFVQHCGNQLGEVRLVAIVRREPECWEQIDYDPAKSPWCEIALVDLPDLSVEDARRLVIELAATPPFPLRVTSEIADAIARTNDGTFYHLILAFRDWRNQPNKREITAQDAASLQADLSSAWRHRQSVLFQHEPRLRYVYGALDLAQAVRLPPHQDLIAILAQSLREHLIVNIQAWATVGWKWVQRRFLGHRWIRGVDARINRLNMKATVWLQGLLLWPLHRLLDARCRSVRWFHIWTSLSLITFWAALTLVSFGSVLIVVAIGMLALYLWLFDVAPLVGCAIGMLMLLVAGVPGSFLIVLELLWAGRWISERLVFLDRISLHRATRYLVITEIPMVGSILIPYDSQVESTAQAFSTQAWVSKLMQAPDMNVRNHFLSSALQCWFDRANFDVIGWEVGARVGEVLVRLEPENSSAHSELGWCYLLQGQLDEAFAAFQRAIELDPDYAAPHNRLGIFYAFQDQQDEAIAAYRRAIELDPNVAVYHNNLGAAYIQLGRHNEAIAAYRRAIQLAPRWIAHYINLGKAYEFLGRHEEAVASYWQAIRLAPRSAHPYKGLGGVYLVLGRHEEAIAAYQRAIEVDPDDAVSHNDLGFVYAGCGRYEEAIAKYQKAIKLDPSMMASHINLAALYVNLGRYEEAIAAYQRAIEFDPNIATFHTNLGEAYRTQDRYDEALDAYHRAIELGADDAITHNNLGVTCAALGQHDEAIAAYQTAIELDPNIAAFHTNLGEAYRAQGRYDEALAAYHHAIELGDDDAVIHNNLGVAYAGLSRHEEAIAAYQKAIALDPNLALPHRNLGLTYHNLGRYDEAIAAYQRAIELDPDDTIPHNSLGDIYAGLGWHEEAIAEYQKAVELEPNLAASYRGLGLVYAALGQHDEAIVALQRAIELDPEDVVPYKFLGLVCDALDRHKEAIAAYQKAIAFDPSRTLPHLGLAGVYRHLGDEAKWQHHLAQARRFLKPDNYYGLACLESITGNVEKALDHLAKALKQAPVNRKWARYDPDLAFIRDNPRFQELVGERGG